MRRVQVSAVLILLWAGIYLPGLGTLEFKGEEPRRVFPAIQMLETGDWLVPQQAGKEYLKKPPLVNWAVACSFVATGSRGEMAARLPSALMALAFGLTIVIVGSGWLGVPGAFLAAIFALTNIGMMEKGRLIEIDAIYSALYGIALTCWLSWWARDRSRWLTWVVPYLFLGLGLLAKGPLHLLYFWGVLLCVLVAAGRVRDLFAIPHVVGLTLMAGVLAAWLVPFLLRVSPGDALSTWSSEMGSRLSGDGGGGAGLAEWIGALLGWGTKALSNVLRGLSNYLPWLVLIPALWSRQFVGRLSGKDLAVVRGGRVALLGLFFGALLFPGVEPRYTMPLLAPASLLLGRALLCDSPGLERVRLAWRWVLGISAVICVLGALAGVLLVRTSVVPVLGALWAVSICTVVFGRVILARSGLCGLAAGTAGVIGVLVMDYAMLVAPRQTSRGGSRDLAAAVTHALPDGKRLHGVNTGFHPFLCYLPPGTRYVTRIAQLPGDAEYLLFTEGGLEKARERERGIEFSECLRFRGQDRPPGGSRPPEMVLARMTRREGSIGR